MASKQIKDKLRPALKIIDPWLDYKLWYNRIPGLSFALLYEDKILFSKGYGWADVKEKKKATPDTCYRIASISKIFTAISIMQLREQGKLKLDDKVSQHLRWFASPKSQKQDNITIREILSHQAGIERDSDKRYWLKNEGSSVEEIKDQVKKGVKVYESLEKFKYSSLGFAILGQIIKEASGTPYGKYVKKNIIDKLGLRYTSATVTEKVKQKLAAGYSREMPNQKRKAFPVPETRAVTPALGLTSNAPDLCKFLSSLFPGKDVLLNEKSRRMMQKERTTGIQSKNISYGLGWAIYNIDGLEVVGHTGAFQGYITAIGMLPEKKIGVVALTNAIDSPAFSLMKGAFQIIHYFLKNHKKSSISKKEGDLAKYEGNFSNIWTDRRFVSLNGHLVYFYPKYNNPMDRFAILKHTNKHTFKIVSGDEFDYIGEEVRFEFDEKGRVKKVYIGPTPYKPFSLKKRQKNEGN